MKPPNHLRGARIYLSGPMDFVASRLESAAESGEILSESPTQPD
jgi:hypothetical protein